MKMKFNPLTAEFDFIGVESGETSGGVTVNYFDNSNVPSISLTMQADNRYLFSSPVGLLVVSVDRFTTETSHVYELDFVAGDNISVKMPDLVKWVKTPVFNPGKRYLISIDAAAAAGKTSLTGMYLEMEA